MRNEWKSIKLSITVEFTDAEQDSSTFLMKKLITRDMLLPTTQGPEDLDCKISVPTQQLEDALDSLEIHETFSPYHISNRCHDDLNKLVHNGVLVPLARSKPALPNGTQQQALAKPKSWKFFCQDGAIAPEVSPGELTRNGKTPNLQKQGSSVCKLTKSSCGTSTRRGPRKNTRRDKKK